MKPQEFYDIMVKFVTEQKFWLSLNVGDIIYDVQARFGDTDYHEMRIDSINVDERIVVAHDVSLPTNIRTMGYFLTEEEFKKLQV